MSTQGDPDEAAAHFRAVYSDGVEDYAALVAHEDAAGLLWQHLDGVRDWATSDVIELGAGTGRITVELAARARSVRAFDASAQMLAVARRGLDERGLDAELTVAEHRALPADDASADAVIEGWAVAHYVDWEPQTWPDALAAAIAEAARVLRPGGTIVLIETLGTGVTEPTPPSPALAALYEQLETTHAFARAWVRTDYAFPDRATAEAVVGRFFGEEMLAHLDGATLPECTGIWTRAR